MAKSNAFDMNSAVENFFGAFKMDTSAFETAGKNVAEFNVKLGAIALNAAKANMELTTKFTADVLKSIEDNNVVPASAEDFASKTAEVVSSHAQAMPEKMTAYADVAKKAQVEATELFTAAGKEVQAEVAKSAKKAA